MMNDADFWNRLDPAEKEYIRKSISTSLYNSESNLLKLLMQKWTDKNMVKLSDAQMDLINDWWTTEDFWYGLDTKLRDYIVNVIKEKTYDKTNSTLKDVRQEWISWLKK